LEDVVLESLDVGRLQALGAADNLELNGLSLIKGAVAIRDDGGEMDENVLSGLALDETKALAGVKPLHCTLFLHFDVLFSNKLSDASLSGPCGIRASSVWSPEPAVRRAENKKGRKLNPATSS
jgi:hypothetical protein